MPPSQMCLLSEIIFDNLIAALWTALVFSPFPSAGNLQVVSA